MLRHAFILCLFVLMTSAPYAVAAGLERYAEQDASKSKMKVMKEPESKIGIISVLDGTASFVKDMLGQFGLVETKPK